MTRYIGLGHYSRTGKDTLANYLVLALKRRKITASKVPLAWKLKDIAHQLYGWAGVREPEYYDTKSGEAARDVKIDALGATPVELWVKLGTPAIREQVYDRTWLDFVLQSDHGVDVVVTPDIRNPNEVDGYLERDALLVKVVRPGVSPRKTVTDQALVGYKGWHLTVGSTGKLEELYAWSKAIANWIRDGGELPKEV